MPVHDLQESIARLSSHARVLRELVHRTCGWIALEPSFEVKCILAEHVADDALAIAALRDRLAQLCSPADRIDAPADELGAALDRVAGALDGNAYERIVYRELKPAFSKTLSQNEFWSRRKQSWQARSLRNASRNRSLRS